MKGELGKVYLGDDEQCDIVRKGNVMVSLSNGSMLSLRNVGHVPKLKRNLISVGQLVDGGMKTIFDDVCKITKSGDDPREKRRYPLHDVGFRGINFSCFTVMPEC